MPATPLDPSTASIDQKVQSILDRSRTAGVDWSRTELKQRLRLMRKLRKTLVAAPRRLAEQIPRADLYESLLAEILPLADALRFLEQTAHRTLREQTLPVRGRPLWLWGTRVVLRREPLGVILVLAPRNYPLMLPGIQAIQALAAGNTVVVKPAPGCRDCLMGLQMLMKESGFPDGIFEVLPDRVEAATAALEGSINKVILTGSAETGHIVRQKLASSGIPSTMELSGCDAVFVHASADINLVCDCILFGLTMNHSQTCIAPRRIFVTEPQAERLAKSLMDRIQQRSHPGHGAAAMRDSLPELVRRRTGGHIQEAIESGATLLTDSIEHKDDSPLWNDICVLDHVDSSMPITRTDLFAPVTSIIRVASMHEAVRQNADCPYSLSASVFGTDRECQELARQIDAGSVVINDMIAPTADPRVPFGGRHQSGSGMTRGTAGLEELTQIKAVIRPRPWYKPHLASPTPVDVEFAEQLIQIEHAPSPLDQLKVLPGLLRNLAAQIRYRRTTRNRS